MAILNILVMGGTRFNGQTAVLELAKFGHRVTVFNLGESPEHLPPSVARLHGDRREHDVLADSLDGKEFDCVLDVSAYRWKEDVEPLLNVLKGRMGHYIFISSTSLYTSPTSLPIREGAYVDRQAQSEYGWHKLDVEERLFTQYRSGGVPATTVALSMVMGPHNDLLDREQRMFARLLAGRPVLIPGHGNTLQQVGYVEDQARAVRLMMLNPVTYGKRYNVTGNDFWTDNYYVDVMSEVVGVEPKRVNIPHEVMDELWNSDERRLVGTLIPRLQTAYNWNEHMIFSIDRVRRDLGWEPEYAFESAVAQTWDWYHRVGRDMQSDFDWSFEDAILERLA